MPDYLYLLHPYRDGFYEQPTDHENRVMEAHFEYLRRAADSGVVLLAGPCLDNTFGLVVFRAENDEAARTFMLADPSVENDVMMTELHPLHISLKSI